MDVSAISTISSSAKLDDNLSTPQAPKVKIENRRPKRDSSAKCLTLDQAEAKDMPTTSKSVSKGEFHKKTGLDDDWQCGLCERTYSSDCRKKNGANWIGYNARRV